jgi:hypothetical protein
MTAGPDGAVWFDENSGPAGEPAIGRLTPGGALSEVSLGDAGVEGIAATDDAIYFTEANGPDAGLMRIPVDNLTEPAEATYVALGDSYSSGEGDPPYELGSDVQGDTCHRSQQAYGPLIDGALKLVGCSSRRAAVR